MGSLGNIYLKFGADISQLKSGISSIDNQLSGFSKNISAIGKSLAGAFAVRELASFGADAIKMSSDIESSFLKIKNLTDTTTDDLAYFKKGIGGISSEVGRSQQELSKGLYAITSSGLVGKEALDALKLSSQASAIGLGDVDTVARSLSGVLLAYGKENISAARASEILFQTLKFGNLEAEQLAPNLGKILPVASALGISMEQVGAGIAQISLSGADAGESVTYLKSILAAFSKATPQAEAVLKELDLTMADVRDMASKDLAGAIQFLNTKLGGNVEKINDLLGRQEAVTGWFSLVGRNAAHYGEVVQGVSADTHDFDTAMKEVSQSSAQRWAVFTAQMANVKAAIGDALINLITQFLPQTEEGIKSVNDALNSIPGIVKNISDEFKRLQQPIENFVALYKFILDNPIINILPNLQKDAFKALLPRDLEIPVEVKVKNRGDLNQRIPSSNRSSLVQPGFAKQEEEAAKAALKAQQSLADIYNKPLQKPKDPSKGKKIEKPDILFTDDLTQFEKDLYGYQTAIDELSGSLTPWEENMYDGYQGLKLMSDQILDTSGTYDVWGNSLKNLEGFADSSGRSVDGLTEKAMKAKDAFAQFGEGLKQIVEGGIGESIGALGEQIGSAFSGGKFDFRSILTPLADMLINVGKLAIATGIALEGIKKALSTLNPIAAIAGGIALVALGSFVKSKLTKVNKFAKGALSYDEHLGVIGDNPNARFDPEVTAPSSKLKGLFEKVTLPNILKNFQPSNFNTSQVSGQSQITLNGEFRISGTDLVMVLDKQKAIQIRQRGF